MPAALTTRPDQKRRNSGALLNEKLIAASVKGLSRDDYSERQIELSIQTVFGVDTELIRDETLRSLLVSDPHSPGRYRVNGVVRNVDPWYEAFQIPAKATLALPVTQRVRIW